MADLDLESQVADIKREDLMKSRIVGATEKLLNSKSIDKISVTEICRESGISRQTFYQHFESKYDIAKWRWGLIGEKFAKEMGRTLTVYEATLNMLEESACYSKLFYNEDDLEGYEKLFSWSTRMIVGFLRETITDHLHRELTEELDFQIQFYIDEVGRIVYRDGHKYGHRENEKLAGLLSSCVPPLLANALEEGESPANGEDLRRESN